RLDELPLTPAWAVADGAKEVPVPVDFEDLPVLARRQPGLTARIDVEPAGEIPHLNRPDEPAFCVVDDETVFLAVADVDLAVRRVDRDRVNHAEVALARVVPEPLVDELAVPVQVNHARGADPVRR